MAPKHHDHDHKHDHDHRHERDHDHRDRHERDRHGQRSLAEAFIDAKKIDAILMPLVTDAADRSFVVRCLTDEGPVHHRGANWILIALLAELAGPDLAPTTGPSARVPLSIPPHLRHESDGDFPVAIPLELLTRLAGGDQRVQDAMVDSLTDGPSHHAIANAVMLCLIDAALRRRKA